MGLRLRRRYRALLLGGILLLGACSSTTFVYNRLDFLVPWYVDDYAELNTQQELYLANLLAPFLTWHRSQELPAYVEIIAAIQASLDQPQTPAGVEATFARMEAAWLRLEDAALTWLLDLGAQLSAVQIAGFLEVLQEQQAEFEEEFASRSDEEFQEDSYDNLAESVKDYLGALSAEQQALLHEASRRLLRSDRAWLAERTLWLQELAVLLKREPQWQQRLRDAVSRRRGNPSPDYLRIYEHNMRVIYELVATLLNGRSEKQDRFLREKLDALHRDLDTLIAEGRPLVASP